jgi:hypothetical protein
MVRNVKERLNQVPIAIGMGRFNGFMGEASRFLPNPQFLIPLLQSSLTGLCYPSTGGLSGSMWPVLTGYCRFLSV